ncbi:MAG TPA: TetR/AcrR family transcriptional regulator [Microbacteriaceae bacterium]
MLNPPRPEPAPHLRPTTSARRTTRALRRDATENRAAILVAAATVLNRDINAPISAVADEAGLSRRSIYGHFATRDDLVTEVLTRGAERVAASLEPISHPDARVEIALFGSTLWSEVEHVRVMAQLAVRGPHREQVARALEPARRRLRASVERGVAAEQLREDIEPATLARLIEGAALSVLDEVTRTDMSARRAHSLVMRSGLSTAGLGWREADALIAATPQLTFREGAHA